MSPLTAPGRFLSDSALLLNKTYHRYTYLVNRFIYSL
nr:MAG TPA: hypothetical protein [Bacteriophage sp.]